VILGGAIAALTYHAAVTNGLTPGLPKIASSIVNEVLAPIGCAMVIYFGLMIGRNLKIVFREQ
jgi:hypothetical protein